MPKKRVRDRLGTCVIGEFEMNIWRGEQHLDELRREAARPRGCIGLASQRLSTDMPGERRHYAQRARLYVVRMVCWLAAALDR
jgi:hypothetical protein